MAESKDKDKETGPAGSPHPGEQQAAHRAAQQQGVETPAEQAEAADPGGGKESRQEVKAREERAKMLDELSGRSAEPEPFEPRVSLAERAAMDAYEDVDPKAGLPNRKLLEQAAERERAMTRVQGVVPEPEEESNLGPTGLPTLWVVSNRRDNRVVAWWRDPAQPGGEAFVGGPTPAKVALTPEVERLLLSGEAIEVPEPQRFALGPDGKVMQDAQGAPVPNRKYPAANAPEWQPEFAAQPGRAIPLNRELDPDLFTPAQRREIRSRQARIPAELPAPIGGIVPGVTHQVA